MVLPPVLGPAREGGRRRLSSMPRTGLPASPGISPRCWPLPRPLSLRPPSLRHRPSFPAFASLAHPPRAPCIPLTLPGGVQPSVSPASCACRDKYNGGHGVRGHTGDHEGACPSADTQVRGNRLRDALLLPSRPLLRRRAIIPLRNNGGAQQPIPGARDCLLGPPPTAAILPLGERLRAGEVRGAWRGRPAPLRLP